jgi:hypothetical protein
MRVLLGRVENSMKLLNLRAYTLILLNYQWCKGFASVFSGKRGDFTYKWGDL